jgi:putative protease
MGTFVGEKDTLVDELKQEMAKEVMEINISDKDEFIEKGKDYKFNPEWMVDLEKASHREFSTGFYYDNPGQIYENSSYIRNYDIVGMVIDYHSDKKEALIEQRNRVFKGDNLEVFSPHDNTFSLTLDHISDENGEEIEVAPHPQMKYRIHCDKTLKPFDMLIKQKEE